MLHCRLLRDKWQMMSDKLTDHQQQMKDSLFQISTHEENLNEFCTWLQEAESKLKRDSDIQPTLQAKRALLQHVKVIEQNYHFFFFFFFECRRITKFCSILSGFWINNFE
jgi:hypothetical protein